MLDGVTPFPPERAATYRAAGYWTGATFPDLLQHSIRQRGDALAVADDRGHELTYHELGAAVEAAAARLHALGIRDRDRVVVQFPNVISYLPTVFALFRLGALPIFALPGHRERELTHFVQHADAVAIITVRRHGRDRLGETAAHVAEQVAAARAEAGRADAELIVITDPDALVAPAEPGLASAPAVSIDPEDTAFLQLSGGTTGVPKMIPRSSDAYIYTLRRSNELCGVTERSVYLAALPVPHNFTMSSPGVLGVLLAGGTVVLASAPAPDTCFDLIARRHVTITALVPPLALLWADHVGSAASLESLEVLQIGGAKLTPTAARRIVDAFDCTLQQVFGMAEGLVNYTALDAPLDEIVETQGRPMSPADELRIVDDSDQPLPQGTAGNLVTRGPYTINGYYRAAETNRSSFTHDGFYRTGDIVRIDDTGSLIVEGRSKDLINRGGEKVVAAQVEDALLQHPRVFDAVVVPKPDDRLGETIAAFVQLRSATGAGAAAGAVADAAAANDADAVTADADAWNDPVAMSRELRAFLRDVGLASFCVPDEFHVIDEMPVTAVGKSSRRDLRNVLAARLTD
ncbi:AMP-binding protein [Pseudoclavibacter sp. CFCC 13796]|uniref:(2,3-dihydroxybenzoyl)adenylate synthase n=1 Tax=Pseudoclavibacter sp. CFCC 13796 TaxID=2615179 RepID=UPI001300F91A|nr:AMP-binding protein [Pseudoclavibacter sp. CFCC 13796]KAB1661167.1 AMP-binding protein [Pseudoclavibacter sp. CFCC 13796]